MFVGGTFYLAQRLKHAAPLATLPPGAAMADEIAAALSADGFRVMQPLGGRMPKTGVIIESRLEEGKLYVRLIRGINRKVLREAEFDAKAPDTARKVAAAVRSVM